MILVDANVFLRYLTFPETEVLQRLAQTATHLFDMVQRAEIEATTTEVVLHEVCYVLTSPRNYSHSSESVIDALREILIWPGWVFGAEDRAAYLRALDLWQEHPKLEFSDAVIAARCEQGGHELATFDRHFHALPSINRWSPSGS